MNLYAAAAGPRRGTPSADDVQSLLNSAGLHSTRQRIALASLLLRTANRPVTAEILYEEAHESQCFVLRATVCNALRHFERAGLLSVGCPARSSLELHYPRLHHHAAAAEADAPLDRPLVLARKRSRDLRAPAASIEPAAPPSPPTPFPAFTAWAWPAAPSLPEQPARIAALLGDRALDLLHEWQRSARGPSVPRPAGANTERVLVVAGHAPNIRDIRPMSNNFSRDVENIARNRTLRPTGGTPRIIAVPLVGDKTDVQTTTSHRTVPANAVRFWSLWYGLRLIASG